MGKGAPAGPSPEVEKGMLDNQSALVKIAQGQAKNAEQLYNLTEPGLVTAENFYETLASGDPGAIMRAISPAAQQTSEAAAGAKRNIMDNAPSGGEKNLALEMVDVGRGAEVAHLASGATVGAPNALAQLAGQGVGESISAAGTGISGFSSANQGLASLGNMQIQEQQIQAEQKGQMMGGIGSLVGAGAQLGSAAIMAAAI